ncbi:MAG: hypothetical protein KME52_07695 [Desmonostoc geniculatum HA4340-LM1]|nr:hypothetical protein [Desmonostoc geniculatum HA4340-LM1]
MKTDFLGNDRAIACNYRNYFPVSVLIQKIIASSVKLKQQFYPQNNDSK